MLFAARAGEVDVAALEACLLLFVKTKF